MHQKLYQHAMNQNRKYLIDRFEKHLRSNYESYCERHSLERTENQMVTFLIDQDLIPPTLIQRYAVINEYRKLNEELEGHKTLTVSALAHRFNISERTVWSILKHVQPGKKLTGMGG
jgi:AraC-like DNA-binding protein